MCVCVCVCVCARAHTKDIYLRNWLIRLCKFKKSKICGVGWQAGDPGNSRSLSLKIVSGQNSFFLKVGQSLFY